MFLRKRYPLAPILGLLMILAACKPMTTDTPLPPTPTPGEVDTTGSIFIEDLEIRYLESFPLQIHVVVKGNLGDGCTEIDEIVQERNLEENTYTVTITTIRDPEAVCTQALVPFEEVIPLDVYGIEAGTYTVEVNDQSTTFTLDMDNVPPPEPGVAPVDAVSVAVEGEEIVVDVEGNLPDDCTEIDAVNQRYDADSRTFFIEITTLRPGNAACAEVLVPYAERVTFDAAALELEAGEYTVNANDVTETFTLEEGIGNEGEGEEGEVMIREAMLQSMDIQVMESFPVQATVVVKGDFRDGCSEFGPVEQARDVDAKTLTVTVKTTRPADAMCTQALVPFEASFALDLEGLPAGTYTVLVNGIEGQVVLARDNVSEE